ncbi:D-alanyl-D-alanine carboxypeptidase precursor [Thalassovita gelatinovora]|uniref:D-alanyl-D-alanine carboxypeptidase n=1 Tax=Thalassovita gelatinovora TaxID=53501 RepID=A0A0P1FGM0_THAGE|nr:serine hydrolase domain-containing protein [Thalassovita gelatinovora]QIZ81825.1 beta-lactamase family protein [Thalassovita gelatinovora]CUH67112.1 D-alanyl-D-alanine carboxypeptidase precursor [Thalassovita gelatinovora]SEP80317.1 Beta-lactamase [Thalassovita gelatinovora]
MSAIANDLQAFLDQQALRKNMHGIQLGVQSGDGSINFEGAAGAATADQPFFMASITKMFTATVLMQFVDEGLVRLDDKVVSHLPHIDLTGIHMVRGKDCSNQLTLRHLVHQTSGLADYFEGDFVEELERGKDRAFCLTDVLQMVRGMEAQAATDSGKSHYSDTNYQLFGAVIEAVTGEGLQSVFSARIFEPVGMCDTFIFDHTTSQTHPAPVPLFHRSLRLDLPLALSNMASDGGGVWTLTDGLRFLRAYFAGVARRLRNNMAEPGQGSRPKPQIWRRSFRI